MKKALKWIGIAMAGLVGIVMLIGVVGYVASERRINKSYSIAVEPFAIPTDTASIEEGRRLTIIRGCVDCHGTDYGGSTLLENPIIGRIYGANLTSGEGSATAGWSPEDWARAIRNGIAPDGRGILMMPSYHYAGLSDQDLGRMIAYLRSVKPVDRPHPHSSIGPMVRAMLVTNQMPVPMISAEVIDHSRAAPASVPAEVSSEFGAYLATSCTGCHGENLAGGPIPFSPPDQPKAANLTPSGELGHWTQNDFKNTLRTGVTPSGRRLNSLNMPWTLTREMTDVELEALWLYLKSLPPVVAAN